MLGRVKVRHCLGFNEGNQFLTTEVLLLKSPLPAPPFPNTPFLCPCTCFHFWLLGTDVHRDISWQWRTAKSSPATPLCKCQPFIHWCMPAERKVSLSPSDPNPLSPPALLPNDSTRSKPSSGLALWVSIKCGRIFMLHLFAAIIIFWSKGRCRKFRRQYYFFYSIKSYGPTGSFLSPQQMVGSFLEVSLTRNSLFVFVAYWEPVAPNSLNKDIHFSV